MGVALLLEYEMVKGENSMNGWFKKNVGVVVQVIVIAIMLVVASATIKADVSHLKTDITISQEKDVEQDKCIYEINRTLGRIEGKLDAALGGE